MNVEQEHIIYKSYIVQNVSLNKYSEIQRVAEGRGNSIFNRQGCHL